MLIFVKIIFGKLMTFNADCKEVNSSSRAIVRGVPAENSVVPAANAISQGRKYTDFDEATKKHAFLFLTFADLRNVQYVSKHDKLIADRCITDYLKKPSVNLWREKRLYKPPSAIVCKMPNLTSLDMSNVPLKEVRRIFNDAAFATNQGPKITSLNLRNVWSDADDGGKDVLTDADLVTIAKACPNLQELTIGNSWHVTLSGLCVFAPNLRKLSLGKIELALGVEATKVQNFGKLAASQPNLKIFEIEGANPTLERYKAILAKCPNLERCSFPWKSIDQEYMEDLKKAYPRCSFAPSTVSLFLIPPAGVAHADADWLESVKPILENKDNDFSHVRALRIYNPLIFNTRMIRKDKIPVKPEHLKSVAVKFPCLKTLHVSIFRCGDHVETHNCKILEQGHFDSVKAFSHFPRHLQNIIFETPNDWDSGVDGLGGAECRELSMAFPYLTGLEFKRGISKQLENNEIFLEHLPLLRSCVHHSFSWTQDHDIRVNGGAIIYEAPNTRKMRALKGNRAYAHCSFSTSSPWDIFSLH